jgi:hypothetical protein
MSATRDKSQKIAFVYSNLYELYKKGKEAAQSAEVPPAAQTQTPIVDQNPEAEPRPFGARPGLTTSRVIKASDPAAAQAYTPPSFTAKRFEPRRVSTPAVLHQARAKVRDEDLKSLRSSLEQLQNLHARLRFMLGELEELSAADYPNKKKK